MTDIIRNLAGQKFGKLVAIEATGKASDGHTLWQCRCECGEIKNVAINNLGRTTFSCGIGACFSGYKSRTHGHTVDRTLSRTYETWRSMIQRCANPNNNRYQYYGGRGIIVCDRWLKFVNFLEDMGERPADRSIDRIDNDGNYCLENCRWATNTEQVRHHKKWANPAECARQYRKRKKEAA